MMKEEMYRVAGVEEIETPALAYYPDIIRRNIKKMVTMAGDAKRLWPHVKTHKSAGVTGMLLEAGIDSFKCATIAEAEMCARCGATRVCVAYPLVGPNIPRFISLNHAYPETEFFAIGDDEGQLLLLGNAAAAAGITVNVLIDVDAGQHRTGVTPEKILPLAEIIAGTRGLRLRGFHVYDGHHHEPSPEVRRRAVEEETAAVFEARDAVVGHGLDCGIILSGGTPTFPCHQRTGVYLSPGTCVIQDAGYADAYADLPFEPAAAVLTRVISHPGEGLFTLDLGCKAVAADPPVPRAVIVGYEHCETVTHNEEHLVLRMPAGEESKRPPIGAVCYAIPWHICPTTLLYPEVLAVEDGEFRDHWPVTARDRKITI